MMDNMLTIAIRGLTPAMMNNEKWKAESLEYWVGSSLKDSLVRLKKDAIAEEHFQYKTGELERHFAGEVLSWNFPVIAGVMFNDSPYAWRRDRGFSGMTDSLGRFFPSDPGSYYMEKTLMADEDWIVARFKSGVRKALAEYGTSGTNTTTGGTP